jgi:hypothetical protein
MMHVGYLEQYESYLVSAPPEQTFQMHVSGGGGHRDCFGVSLDRGVTCYVKPCNGTPASKTALYNEVAAWETAKLLGWSHLMAPTVLCNDIVSPVTMTATTSSLQVFRWDAQPAPVVTSLSTIEVVQAGTFDYLIAHSDRPENSNYLGVTPATSSSGEIHLKLIDNGFAYDFPNRPPQSVFVDQVRGRHLGQSVISAVKRLRVLAPVSPLTALLSPPAFAGLMARAERLVLDRCVE